MVTIRAPWSCMLLLLAPPSPADPVPCPPVNCSHNDNLDNKAAQGASAAAAGAVGVLTCNFVFAL